MAHSLNQEPGAGTGVGQDPWPGQCGWGALALLEASGSAQLTAALAGGACCMGDGWPGASHLLTPEPASGTL